MTDDRVRQHDDTYDRAVTTIRGRQGVDARVTVQLLANVSAPSQIVSFLPRRRVVIFETETLPKWKNVYRRCRRVPPPPHPVTSKIRER